MDQIYAKFTINELACRCGKCGYGQIEMHPLFMEKIVKLRVATGISMPITSAARCPEHNNNVSSTGRVGPHTPILLDDRFGQRCHAIDINIWGEELAKILKAIGDLKLEFTGFGFNQKGSRTGRFLHLDDLPNMPGRHRPWVWTY